MVTGLKGPTLPIPTQGFLYHLHSIASPSLSTLYRLIVGLESQKGKEFCAQSGAYLGKAAGLADDLGDRGGSHV